MHTGLFVELWPESPPILDVCIVDEAKFGLFEREVAGGWVGYFWLCYALFEGGVVQHVDVGPAGNFCAIWVLMWCVDPIVSQEYEAGFEQYEADAEVLV